jgi:hypothetical protein
MPSRTVILSLIVIIAFVPLLNAQYIRIANAGVIPNGAMMSPTILITVPDFPIFPIFPPFARF